MTTLNEVITRRKQLRKNQRFIFNDDGANIYFYDTAYGFPVTESAFLEYLLGPHRGVGNYIVPNPAPSDITTFVFNTAYSGEVRHKSTIPNMFIGNSLKNAPIIPDENPGDATQAIIDETGKDGLQIAGEFLENEPVEFIYEVRANDRHDALYDKADLNPIKQNLWDAGGLMVNGECNGVDYSYADSKQLMIDTTLEIVNNPAYKINGVCLNFYRHFGNFANMAVTSQPASPTSQAQIDIMTDFVKQINDAMNVRSQTLMDQGKEPLLLFIKIADHPDFNKKVGLDVDDWIKKDYVDVVTQMGYHQFQYIRDSVAYYKKQGVGVVPSYSDPRPSDSNRKDRNEKTGRRGRFLQILGAGGDGVEFFNQNYSKDPNYFGQSGEYWRSLSKDKMLAWDGGTRKYYQTWTNQAGNEIGTQTVLPERVFPQYMPWVLESHPFYGNSGKFGIEIYEDQADIGTVTLRLYVTGAVSSADVNGNGLTLVSETYGYSASVDKTFIKSGINLINLSGVDFSLGDIEVEITNPV